VAGSGGGLDEVFHHLEIAFEKILVKAGGECFEVNVHGVDVWGDFVEDFGRCSAVCYKDILHAGFF